MTFAKANTTHILATAVADAGTVNVSYPTGFVQGDLSGSTGGQVVVNDNDLYPQASSGAHVTFAFNGPHITVTNNSGVSWPAGAELILSFGTKEFQDDPDMSRVYEGPTHSAIASPAGGATVDAEARTAIDAILTALRNAGIVASA